MTITFVIFILFSTVILANFVQSQEPNDNLWAAYQKCKITLGKPNWLCDPNNRINNDTAKQLNELLWQFQTEVPCYCKLAKDCYRYGNVTVMSGVVAAMIIVDSFPKDFSKTIKTIYEDAGLDVRGSCSNGLLIVLGYKTYEMFTFRGMLTGMTLSEAQAKAAMNSTALDLQATGGESRFALPRLLMEYIDRLKSVSYGRSRDWEAMVGMVCAVIICAIAAAIALAIFFASCCLRKRKKPWRKMQALMPPSLTATEKARQTKLARAAMIRHQKKALTSPKPTLTRNSMPQPIDETYYHVSEPASTMYSTLPRSRYPGSPIYGYGAPEAESSPRQPPGKGTTGRGRRHSLPMELQQQGSPTAPYPYPNLDPEASPFSTATSQAYLIPPYHLPLHLERETQSKNYFIDEDTAATPSRHTASATPAASTPKERRH